MGRGPVRRLRSQRVSTKPPSPSCAHCGKKGGPKATYAGVALCFSDSSGATACWRRVRAGEQLGALKDVRPLPPGMEQLRVPARA